MNKNLYRIVFNKARGILMVVAENVSAQGKGDADPVASIIVKQVTDSQCMQMRLISFAAKLAAGIMSLVVPLAQAQIIADPNAPGNQRPTILQTANRLPQVNIQTPSAAGVSRNTYSQFDVQSQGAILNNSRTNTATQTGGWVQANPWLVGGAARVILNEVNSSNSSQLRGYIEVAGQRAEVIIANPAGIQVNGGGFINADRVTLTSGTAVMNGGSLDSYRIPKGTISIDGLGLDTRTANYTDILARSVQVNAGIWANRLKVITGANEVSRTSTDYPGDVSQGVTPIAGTGPVPQFSLDVAAIGGMYAGHIYLVGSEAGMGVRNQGAIAANGGNLVLLSNGLLTNEGAIQAASANGTGGNLRIETTGQINNLGANVIISAQGKADIKTQAALLNTDGTIVSGGAMSIESAQLSNAGGLIQAGGALSINTNQQVLDNTRAASHVSGAGGIVSQGAIMIQSGDLKNDAGYVGSVGAVKIEAAEVSNTDDGQIVSQSDIHVTATGIDNTAGPNNVMHGQIQAFGNITLDAGAGTINNKAALIRSAKDVVLTAGTVLNQDTLANDYGIEGKNIAITAAAIDNTSGAIRSDELASITSSGALDNTQGLISSVALLTIQDNAAQKTLAVSNTGGTIIAGSKLTIDTAEITGDGKLLSAKDLSLTLTGDFTNSGKLQASEALVATANNIENTVTGEIAASTTTLNAQQELINRGVIDGVKTRVNAETFTNIGTGRIYGDHLSIGATTLRNDTETLNGVRKDAVIAARNRLDIGVQTLINRDHALIFSAGTGAHALNIGGSLDVDGFAVGRATTVTNGSATIESMGDLNIAAAQLSNLNLHFTTSLEVVAGPVGLLYIQPSGSGAKLLSSNFVWENWSRAGQYRFTNSPPPNNSGILGQSPVPRVGEQSCVGDDEATEVCTRVAGADYLSNNPAWSYFSVAAPAAPPIQPSLTEPTPPNVAGGASCTQGAGYNASACTTYNNALATYNTNKQTYDTAWANYQTVHASWEADTDAKYNQLDSSIASYNQQFVGSVIRAWTQYSVTRTESETKVSTSDPGKIFSGGTMRLIGDALINDKSRIIAGGALIGDLVNLRNIEAEGVHVVNEAGTSQYTYSDWRGGFKRYHQRRWDGAIGYYPADEVTTIILAVTEKVEGIAPVGTGTQVIRTAADSTQAATLGSAANAVGTLPTSLPSNSLFQQNPNPLAKYLIETDSRFTNMKQWMGSDYMLTALSTDPNVIHKRLGDGLYEQKLIREQVAELTGRRFLDGYASDEAQYQALMDAGITYAKQWNLVPGIALSSAQMAQLTSDIVWLVSQEVTLADGSKQTVLVPQVYLQVREGDLTSSGALLAGAAVDLKLAGDLTNAGMIAGRSLVQIAAQYINNLGGRLTSDKVALQARGDINIIGGQVLAKDTLVASAGGDLNVISSTQSGRNEAGLSSFTRTSIDRVAGLYVTGASDGQGTLVATSGRDINIAGAIVANYAKDGSTTIQATNDLNLGAVQTSVQENNVGNQNNYLKQGNTRDVGSQIVASGNLSLQGGQDVNAVAASVNAEKVLVVKAGRDVNIQAGEESTNLSESRQHKTSGFLSSKTVTRRTSSEQTNAVASDFGGETIVINSDRDITVAGSNVIADKNTTILAANNLTIEAAQTQQTSSKFEETKRSGLFSGGGISITYGTQEQSSDQKNIRTGSVGSTVGSVAGDVKLVASNRYKQVGSDVVAPGGDIAISAKTVDILAVTDSYTTITEQRSKQSGLTLALTSPVITAMQTVAQMADAAGNTSDGRMKALAGAVAGLSAKNAADAIQAGQGTTINGKDNQIATGTNKETGETTSRDANAADQAGGINLSLSIGASSSSNKTVQSGSHATESNIVAGGDIIIKATGAGQDSDVTIQGSNISGKNVTIQADDKINLLAAISTAEQHSDNKSASGSIGISFGTDGFMINASASQGRGNADGSDVNWINTHVIAANQLTLKSGGDTNLIGADATGKQVTADIGGDLNIQSLQDTSRYDSKQKDMGGGVSIGFGIWSASVNFSKSKVNSDYASVVQQSGIKAGDDGFNVKVVGNTDLKGAVIASTDKAVEDNRNSFSAAQLTTSDINNWADYKADAFGIALGYGSSAGTPNLSGAGIGKDSGHAESTTASGISGIAGNKDVRSGDPETGITKIFNQEQVQKEIDAQRQITLAFSQQAPKAVKDYATTQLDEAKRKIVLADDQSNGLTDEQRATLRVEASDVGDRWRENGSYRIAANILIAALSGGGALASVSKESLSWAAGQMREAVLKDSEKFKGLCVSETDCISNMSGTSTGVYGDNKKGAGGRIVLADWCAEDRCIKDATTETGYQERADGTVIFNPKDNTGEVITLAKFVELHGEWRSPLGGHQGGQGQMALLGFKFDYAPGSFWDMLAEGYGGTHDTLNSFIWYDKLGNGKNLDGTVIGKIGDVTNMTNVVLATPFAASVLFPPELWNAIATLVKAAH